MTNNLTISAAAREFIEDDYQDNVWYNGDQRIESLDDIVPYFERFVQDCASWGRPVPDDLTPEMYFTVWNEIYTASINRE